MKSSQNVSNKPNVLTKILRNLIIKNTVHICNAIEQDFDFIKEHIQLFDLDNRDLQFQQFVVAKTNGFIVGFGRIRKHNGCDELCSLGILEAYRKKGIAKTINQTLIKLATQTIYLVCIIPEFFEPMGFSIVTQFPPEILDKLNYCKNELVVEEPYVVMKFNTN